MRRAGHVACMEDRKGAHRLLVSKPEGRKTIGRTRRRLEINIKIDLRNWDVGVWTGIICLRRGTGGRLL
jgi:tRNA(Ser,Leu) C12 N-acetylase TAN1